MKISDPKKAITYFENKVNFTLGPVELKHRVDKGPTPVIVDVRAAKDFSEGHIPGSINLPEDAWPTLRGLEGGRQHVLYCYSHVCHLAAKAGVFFAKKGFSVMELDGGMAEWKQYKMPVEAEGKEEKMSA